MKKLVEPWPADDVSDTRSLAARKPNAYTPAWSKCRHGREWFARCASRPRFRPCAWRNCGATCVGWHDGLRSSRRAGPFAIPVGELTFVLHAPETVAESFSAPRALFASFSCTRRGLAAPLCPAARGALCPPC